MLGLPLSETGVCLANKNEIQKGMVKNGRVLKIINATFPHIFGFFLFRQLFVAELRLS